MTGLGSLWVVTASVLGEQHASRRLGSSACSLPVTGPMHLFHLAVPEIYTL